MDLYNGDCIEVMKGFSDGCADMVLCDLPYGITARNPWDEVIPFAELWKAYGRVAKEKAAMVFTATQPFASALVMSKPEWFKYEWIWRKSPATGFLNAKKQPLRGHEQVLVFYRSQPTYNPQMTAGKPYKGKLGGKGSLNYSNQPGRDTAEARAAQGIREYAGERYPITILDFKYDKPKVHPTQKPVALMEYLIRTYTREGDTVLDNCMGSGTTGVSCARAGRLFLGIEKDPTYFKMAEERIKAEVIAEKEAAS